jgi:bifunctional pyridoxal-dependent enzyme with beta-cystathionase and maltose regulon repressor activities
MRFLRKFNLEGKKVAFFITSQSEERDAVFEQMRELTPQSEVLATFGLLMKNVKTNGCQEKVQAFVHEITSN